MTKDMNNLPISAQRIKSRRKELGLTQKNLSEKTGIPLQTIKAYECGYRVPDRDFREWLGSALGVYPKWLVGESDIMNIDDMINKMKDGLADIFRDRLELFTSFIAFSECLGYTITLENEKIVLIEGNNKTLISYGAFNKIYSDTVITLKSCFDSLKNAPTQDTNNDTSPYIRIESDSKITEIHMKNSELDIDDARRVFYEIRQKLIDNSSE